MDGIRIPEELLPKSIKSPAAFIAEKHPDLPDYGIATVDLVIIDRDADFKEDELSVFMNDSDEKYRLSNEPVTGYGKHLGKVVMVVKYYGDSPLKNEKGSVRVRYLHRAFLTYRNRQITER